MLAVDEPTCSITCRLNTNATPVLSAPSATIAATTAPVTGPIGRTPVASITGSTRTAATAIWAAEIATGPSGAPTRWRRAYGIARP